MRNETINYVKRCLNEHCTNIEQCEHGKAMIRFRQNFPNGITDMPDFMRKNFRAIRPVACLCPRWQWSREQCIEEQKREAEQRKAACFC